MSSRVPTRSIEGVVSLCSELAKGFADRAAQYDREGRFPVENFRELKESGLLSVMVPQAQGGFGADFLTYTKALEQLAMGDASTALAFNMHNIMVGSLAEISVEGLEGRRGKAIQDYRNWVYDQAVHGKKLFASATSEPGIGARLSKIQTQYRRVDGGFRINGVKSFVSMAGHADYYVVAARADRQMGDAPGISFLVVEGENPGIRIDEVWDTLGMRGTSSNTMYLEDCFVPSERLVLGVEGMALYKSTREPHWLVGAYNGVYLGIATAIFQFVQQYLGGKKIAGSDEPIAHDPIVSHRAGELNVALEAARAVTYDAARLVTESPGSDAANEAIHRAKYMVGEVGPWMASEAIRLCGGSTIFRRMPLERYYRDARCGGLMPAKSDDCLSYVGKAALGIDVRSLAESYW